MRLLPSVSLCIIPGMRFVQSWHSSSSIWLHVQCVFWVISVKKLIILNGFIGWASLWTMMSPRQACWLVVGLNPPGSWCRSNGQDSLEQNGKQGKQNCVTSLFPLLMIMMWLCLRWTWWYDAAIGIGDVSQPIVLWMWHISKVDISQCLELWRWLVRTKLQGWWVGTLLIDEQVNTLNGNSTVFHVCFCISTVC